MRTLYFDCFAGASGNMILGSLIALGVDRNTLVAELKKLEISDFNLEINTVDRSGISSTHVTVRVPRENIHRHLRDVEAIIGGSRLSDSVKERSLAIFTRLAEAEAKVHGIGVGEVHFHEVGAMDAIVDVVGVCVGVEMLGIERFACSKIHLGSGFVEMAHGKFPVPPPAVSELLRGIPTYSTEIAGELITPTGAAIISTLCTAYGTQPEMKVEQTGYGAGTREYEKFPNVLRLMIGVTVTDSLQDQVVLLETNIDDLSPQILGFVMEKAFERGALDCWFTPIQMKKNRPAVMVSVLCAVGDEQKMLDLLYRETTTLGVRSQRIERNCLKREMRAVETEFGSVAVKFAMRDGEEINAQPEFEDLKAVAAGANVAVRDVVDAVKAKLGKGR